MNRLAPLIVRRYTPVPARRAPALSRFEPETVAAEDPLADLKLFATGWLGGLVFFGTLFA